MSKSDIETQALRQMLAGTNVALADAKYLLQTCAPLTWVANQDMDAAHEWEKKAYDFLIKGKRPDADEG